MDNTTGKIKTCFLAFNLMDNSTSDYFIKLSNKLSENYKVIVIAGKIRKTQITLNKTITLLQWPSQRPNSWKDFWFLLKVVRTYKPNIMVSMFSFVNLFLVVGWLFRVKVRVAWIRTLSSQYQQRQYKVLRKSFVYGLATDIVTNSDATKIDVSRFYRIPQRKITVLPNSVKNYKELVSKIPVDKNKLLYVGRLHPSKGIDVLIHAFAKLVNTYPRLHLDIVGQGPSLDELVQLTKFLRIADKVLFFGEKNKNEVLTAYKASYCTVIPSHSEAFGYTVIEAMSVGTCVIGANNTGIKEIINHEDTGLLFKTGNSNDLALQIERLIVDDNLRNRLSQNGYRHFEKCFENSRAINRDSIFFMNLPYKKQLNYECL